MTTNLDPTKAKLDPDADLDYKFDWSTWLADSETIASHTVVASTGITAYNDSESAGVVTVWVKNATAGFQRVTCHIVTSAGRKDDRTIRFAVANR